MNRSKLHKPFKNCKIKDEQGKIKTGASLLYLNKGTFILTGC